jgi:23S rRNA (pseudouridine1915-N3)-methyltransferase
MTFHLVAVGRLKDAALRDACADYANRIRRYVKFRIIEVRHTRGRAHDPREIRRLEGTALLRALRPGMRVVALTRSGESDDSAAFARRVDAWQREARDVAFLVGGAGGIDDAVLQRAETRLSLSALTMPHELTRLVLLEQLYRACTILRGEPYHKQSAP